MSTLSLSRVLHLNDAPDRIHVRFAATAFDDTTTFGIADELYDLAVTRGDYAVWLDLAEVEYIASAVLGKLIVLDHKLRAAGGRLYLRNLQPAVLQVFHIARLNLLLDVRAHGEE